MENNYYSIYLDSVFDLANTLVIKLQYNIDSINNILSYTNPGSFDLNNPRSWKYYLNVSGQYHSSDTAMMVTSLDTMQEVVFSKETLLDHKATSEAYQYGTRFYHELVARYPNQETLILGILYPVDIDQAIAAKEGAIIGYPAYLVEANEYHLIDKLQRWIDGFLFRWVNPSFAIAHDLYYLTMYSILYTLLPQSILQYRSESCLTNEAHSFHVKQFLASHGKLDQYYEQLTLGQSLWLYRNLPYVKKNLGNQDTFALIAKHIMTERKIPLSGYTGYHNVSEMPANLYPNVQFEKKDLTEIPSLESVDPLSLTNMLAKEDKLARLNYTVRMEDTDAINERIENSKSNTVLTKTLESTLFDYSGSSPYSLDNILLYHWIYLSQKGVFNSYVRVDNPKTGETLNLTAKDAFILGFYLYCNSFGLKLLTLPRVIAVRVQRIPLVNKDEIYKMADSSVISKDLAIQMLQFQPVITTITSIDNFYNLCSNIYKAANYQHSLYAYQENYYGRALAQGMASRIYSDTVCDFGSTVQYSDWFLENNIDIDSFLLTDTYDTWNLILQRATGLDLKTTNSLTSIQSAMTNIMASLSSYSVQFVNNINTSPIKIIEFPTIRPGSVDTTLKPLIGVDDFNVKLLGYKGHFKETIDLEVDKFNLDDGINVLLKDNICYESEVMATNDGKGPARTIRIRVSTVSASCTNTIVSNDEGVLLVPGVDTYLALAPEDRVKVADMYGFRKPLLD